MDGKVCSLRKTIQDISIKNIDVKIEFEDLYPQALLLSFIYKFSIISIDKYYETSAYISMKTSNSQHDIDKMEFYVFNNYMVYLEKMIEAENGKNTGEGENSEASQQFNNSMRQAKSMIKAPKIGKIK